MLRRAAITGNGLLLWRKMKLPWMDPRLRELVALAMLAVCGLALVEGELLSVTIFGAARAVAIIEGIRRLQ